MATEQTSTSGIPTRAGGLGSVADVEALADQLSACADQIHARVLEAIRAPREEDLAQAEQSAARALLEEEVLLRQRANGLYADAAGAIVATLGKPQEQVIALTAAAAEKIRTITRLGNAIGLVGALLSLAGAAATGQAAPIVLALEKIHHQLDAIKAAANPA
jgi:hypothetical protein